MLRQAKRTQRAIKPVSRTKQSPAKQLKKRASTRRPSSKGKKPSSGGSTGTGSPTSYLSNPRYQSLIKSIGIDINMGSPEQFGEQLPKQSETTSTPPADISKMSLDEIRARLPSDVKLTDEEILAVQAEYAQQTGPFTPHTSRRTLSSSSPFTPQSTYQWTHLTHTFSKISPKYAVVEIDGPDATKVLHSITTQDLTNFALNSHNILQKQQPDPATFQTQSSLSGFLNSKGRLLYHTLVALSRPPIVLDENILPSPDKPQQVIKKTNQLELASKINAGYYLITAHDVAHSLIAHIRDNSLRLKSKISVRDDLDIYNVLSTLSVI
eukprot:UN04512